jgi:hypothetical protein
VQQKSQHEIDEGNTERNKSAAMQAILHQQGSRRYNKTMHLYLTRASRGGSAIMAGPSTEHRWSCKEAFRNCEPPPAASVWAFAAFYPATLCSRNEPTDTSAIVIQGVNIERGDGVLLLTNTAQYPLGLSSLRVIPGHWSYLSGLFILPASAVTLLKPSIHQAPLRIMQVHELMGTFSSKP